MINKVEPIIIIQTKVGLDFKTSRSNAPGFSGIDLNGYEIFTALLSTFRTVAEIGVIWVTFAAKNLVLFHGTPSYSFRWVTLVPGYGGRLSNERFPLRSAIQGVLILQRLRSRSRRRSRECWNNYVVSHIMAARLEIETPIKEPLLQMRQCPFRTSFVIFIPKDKPNPSEKVWEKLTKQSETCFR
jgi:hypothetical protein